MYQSQERVGWAHWAIYAVVVWCVVFGVLHLYWALGGNVGLAQWSMPSNQTAALTRAPLYIGLTWGVAITCLFGAIVALATTQSWGQRIPRWILLTILWISCGLCVVRGIGNPTQTLLIIAGVIAFEPLDGPLAQAWYQWLLLDSILFSPWFTLGGLAFGATAWFARRRGDGTGRRNLVSIRQHLPNRMAR